MISKSVLSIVCVFQMQYMCSSFQRRGIQLPYDPNSTIVNKYKSNRYVVQVNKRICKRCVRLLYQIVVFLLISCVPFCQKYLKPYLNVAMKALGARRVRFLVIDRRVEINCRHVKVGGRRVEINCRHVKVGGRRVEVFDLSVEIGGLRVKVGGRHVEVGGRCVEVSGRRVDVGGMRIIWRSACRGF